MFAISKSKKKFHSANLTSDDVETLPTCKSVYNCIDIFPLDIFFFSFSLSLSLSTKISQQWMVITEDALVAVVAPTTLTILPTMLLPWRERPLLPWYEFIIYSMFLFFLIIIACLVFFTRIGISSVFASQI